MYSPSSPIWKLAKLLKILLFGFPCCTHCQCTPPTQSASKLQSNQLSHQKCSCKGVSRNDGAEADTLSLSQGSASSEVLQYILLNTCEDILMTCPHVPLQIATLQNWDHTGCILKSTHTHTQNIAHQKKMGGLEAIPMTDRSFLVNPSPQSVGSDTI